MELSESEQDGAAPKKRVALPLVHTANPGSLDLNTERIAEILDEEEVLHFAAMFGDHDPAVTVPTPPVEPPK